MAKDDDFEDFEFGDIDGYNDSEEHKELEFEFPRFTVDSDLIKELEEEWNSGNYEKYAEQIAIRLNKMYDTLISKGFSDTQAFEFIKSFGAYPSQ